MDLVRVVVCGQSNNLYFGAALGKGLSVVFRQPVDLGEVYDVIIRENGAHADAKAKYDVVDLKKVPPSEYPNIRVEGNREIRIKCQASFLEYDKDGTTRIFGNDVYGLIIDLRQLVPRGINNAEIEFRLTSSPRNKFCTICAISKFIKGVNPVVESTNLVKIGKEPIDQFPTTAIGFVWKARDSDILVWSKEFKKNISINGNSNLRGKWIQFTATGELGNLILADNPILVNALCPTRIKKEVAEVYCEITSTGETDTNGDHIWSSSIVGSVLSMKSEFPYVPKKDVSITCWLIKHKHEQHKFKISMYHAGEGLDKLLAVTSEKSSSMFASDSRRPKYSRAEYMLDEEDDEPISDKVENNDDSDNYQTASDNSGGSEVPSVLNPVRRKDIGFVTCFRRPGEAYVYCLNLHRDIILDLDQSSALKLGQWISFDITNDTDVIVDMIQIIEDHAPTRIAFGKPEIKLTLDYDETASARANECILYSNDIGEVLCDDPRLCVNLVPGSRFTPWVIRTKHNGSVCWKVSTEPQRPVSKVIDVITDVGLVTQFRQTGEAYVWCENLGREIVIDEVLCKGLHLGDWISFNITTDRAPSVIDDSIRNIKDRVPTRIASGKPEIKLPLTYSEIASQQYNECVLYNDLVGNVICDIPSLCAVLGSECSLTTWIVRIIHHGAPQWKVSTRVPAPISTEPATTRGSFVQNTPSGSIDSGSIPGSNVSTPPPPSCKLSYNELCGLSAADTVDYAFNQYPELLSSLEEIFDEDAFEHVQYLLQK